MTESEVLACVPEDNAFQVTAEYYIDTSPVEDGIIEFLDLGAGDGRSMDVARRRFQSLRWTGLDIADSAEVRSRTRTDVQFVTYDGVNIPFEAERFDIVYSRQVFEHVRHPEPLLREVARVLKPKGRFIGSVSQIEPFHSDSLWSFTPYGFAVVASEAGLVLQEFRPGIDGLTLTIRNLFMRLGYPVDLFIPWITSESPLNAYLDRFCHMRQMSVRDLNWLKLHYCGHLCFLFGARSHGDVLFPYAGKGQPEAGFQSELEGGQKQSSVAGRYWGDGDCKSPNFEWELKSREELISALLREIAKKSELEADLQKANDRISSLGAAVDDLNGRLKSLFASRSWWITAPLRVLQRWIAQR